MENERSLAEERATIDFQCPKCGAVMYPRCFEPQEGVKMWGIFDNCYPATEQLVFETVNEAIESHLNA